MVDDGSRDGSARAALAAGALVLRHEERRGKGAALRSGLDAALADARFEAALLLDGDGQHRWEEIPRFVEAFARGAELVVGDRTRGLDAMPIARRLTNRVMTRLLRPLVGAGVRDSQCGFRLVSARLYRRLALSSLHFDLESELLIAAHRAGAVAVHVPVSVLYRGERSKIRVVPDAWRFARLLLRYGHARAGGEDPGRSRLGHVSRARGA